ncbi:hypothetical protein SS50377_21964 [Spironucleus salmonicida]|uniref:Uncharacterized protein n=1 Tax=Spironucleus salmonicida TaxID=348837 RepID=V6LRW5_9EUKA|nr:hypothetical protein SS50377_21964 [Spironucleus salmonicida]|eukprot:EST47003.1 Hypothetical protein SS50377_12958 [Spironucleus salmonicida]
MSANTSAQSEANYVPSRLADSTVKIKLQSVQALKEADAQRKRLYALQNKKQSIHQQQQNAWQQVSKIQQQQKEVHTQREYLKTTKIEARTALQEQVRSRMEVQKSIRSTADARKQELLEQKREMVAQQKQEREFLRAYQHQAKIFELQELNRRTEFIRNDIQESQQKVLEAKFQIADQARMKALSEAVQLAERAAHEMEEAENIQKQEEQCRAEIDKELGQKERAKEVMKMTLG